VVDCSFVNCDDNDGGSKWRIAALSAAGPICLMSDCVGCWLCWLYFPFVVLSVLFTLGRMGSDRNP